MTSVEVETSMSRPERATLHTPVLRRGRVQGLAVDLVHGDAGRGAHLCGRSLLRFIRTGIAQDRCSPNWW